MALLEIITGLFPRKFATGTNRPGAASEWGNGLLVQESGGRYLESVANGEVFSVTSGLVATPAAGPLGAGGTPLLALYNPASSKFNAWIRKVGALATALGTTSHKGFAFDIGQTAPITQATTVGAVCQDGSSTTDSDIIAFSNVALTGSTALKRLRPINALGNGGAAAYAYQGVEDLEDSIMLSPGSVLAITALALGVANEAIAWISYCKRLRAA